jgi:hypothetical protein
MNVWIDSLTDKTTDIPRTVAHVYW